MAKMTFSGQCWMGALLTVGLLACGYAKNLPPDFQPSACKVLDPDGKMYLSLGSTVFRLALTTIKYMHDPDPDAPLPIAPDINQLPGCPEHPWAQQSVLYDFSLNTWRRDTRYNSGLPAISRMVIQLSNKEPDLWGESYEEMYLDICALYTGRVTLPNGLQGCLMDRVSTMPEEDEFGAYQSSKSQYMAPFDAPFTVYCNAAIPMSVGAECTVAYKLYQNLNLTYSFYTALLPLNDVIAFDQQLRKEIAATIVSNYPWKNSETK